VKFTASTKEFHVQVGQWVTATKSNGQGDCVKVRLNADGTVSIGDSKQGEDGLTLTFTRKEWLAHLDGAVNGEFNI
jgi:hypothetical protein